MKNVYIPIELMQEHKVINVVAPASEIFGYDKAVAESFEKLNPVLSNGHRCNPITVIRDPSVPREVSAALLQFVQENPRAAASASDMTDNELLAILPSRYMQSEPQLDAVRDALSVYASQLGIGDPADPVDSADPVDPVNPAT